MVESNDCRVPDREPSLSDLHSNEGPARNAIMKMVIRVLLCLAVASISCVCADEVTLSAQKKLKQIGFYDGVVDGQMGSQTAAAIRRFQIAEKLKVTGEMNSQTLRRLGISAPRARVPLKAPAPGRHTSLLPICLEAGLLFRLGPKCKSRSFVRPRRTCDCSDITKARSTDHRVRRLLRPSKHGKRAPIFAKRGDSMKTHSRVSP